MIQVAYEGKKYTYTTVDGSNTWIDSDNVIVSDTLQMILRAKAVTSGGIPISVFVQKKSEKFIEKTKTDVDKPKQRRKKKTTGIKLF